MWAVNGVTIIAMTTTKAEAASTKIMNYSRLRLSANFQKVSEMKDCDTESHPQPRAKWKASQERS